jgi:uncharacterized protein (DUF2267 family)
MAAMNQKSSVAQNPKSLRQALTSDMGDAEAAVSAVFALLADKVTVGEIDDVRRSLPAQIRQLFLVSE